MPRSPLPRALSAALLAMALIGLATSCNVRQAPPRQKPPATAPPRRTAPARPSPPPKQRPPRPRPVVKPPRRPPVILSSRVHVVDRSHPDASDDGPGTPVTPWRTLLHAVQVAVAGDTVLIRRGEYPESDHGVVAVAHSGTSGRRIVFAAWPGDERQVVIPGATFRIAGRSHIVVRGIKVVNVTDPGSPRGFSIEGPGTDIRLTGNETDDTYSSGIAVWGVPWKQDPGGYRNLTDIVIERNLVRRACNGGFNECITVANGVRNVTVRNNEVAISGRSENGGEGIDFKEGVFGGAIVGNQVHDLARAGIYLDAAGIGIGAGGVEDIEVAHNVVHDLDDGEGIELGTEGRGSLARIRVHDNQVRGAKNGVLLYASPKGSGCATDITFENNRCDDNRRYGVRIDWPADRTSGIRVRNNPAARNGDGDLGVARGSAIAAESGP